MIAVLALNLWLGGAQLAPSPQPPAALDEAVLTQRPGATIDRRLAFVDSQGRPVQLSRFFDGRLPVVLTLNYFGCQSVCSVQLRGVARALSALDGLPGRDFRIVTVSVDHRESFELADAAQTKMLDEVDRAGAQWSMLVGDAKSVRALADSVGYGFARVPDTEQFAHPAAIMVLTPDGTVSQYLLGVAFEPEELERALERAGEGRLGTLVDRIVMSCFVWDEQSGSYVPFAWGFMRLGGVLTLFALAFLYLGLRVMRARTMEAHP
jgi:protein SCO1/2